MVGMMNKFITDKTKIYLVYKVDGHIYREREREIYNICTLAENITFICTSLRNRHKFCWSHFLSDVLNFFKLLFTCISDLNTNVNSWYHNLLSLYRNIWWKK